ncbi:Probable RNA-directed DNA polymerase from transposon BS [Eumeta japonica]|uniref:Probable RNA-directed DNA polymerase from transposon BS n=1 Tax=Eumeta variegata TaxID=151549 RepID=A0A4C1YAV8_EUMVA|nr:Probable RNA-directed DNA polymerase from transposon BS [Eumeta japonica]
MLQYKQVLNSVQYTYTPTFALSLWLTNCRRLCCLEDGSRDATKPWDKEETADAPSINCSGIGVSVAFSTVIDNLKDDLDPIIHEEISKHIKALKIREAPVMDSICSNALKCFSAPFVALLVAIFNACIENCYFPTAWKEAVVIGIPKPRKLRDLRSTVLYEPPPPHHFCRRPRNILLDPSDDFTVVVEKLTEANKMAKD